MGEITQEKSRRLCSPSEEPDIYIIKGYAYHKDEIDDEPFLKMLFEREQDLGHPVFMRHDFLWS